MSTPAPFGLYVHWPFCASKCPYCDFNSHVRASIDTARWRRALLTELDYIADAFDRAPLTSIFFGGGTPSLMPPEIAAAVIARAEARWGFTPDIEITLEANPSSVEAGRFADFRAAGVNRVSLGVQALDDDALRFLGRRHDRAEALAALDVARAHFPRLSFDLIYARPGQTAAAWTAELKRALALAADHLSLYQLTIEPGTPFHVEVARGRLTPPDADQAADLYEVTQALCADAGLPAYEISNHARPGAESRHNLVYWRYGPYAGIGPGAHGRLDRGGGRYATVARRAPEAWLDQVEAGGHGIETVEPIPPANQAAELLMMGLRLSEGVSLSRFAALAGPSVRRDERIAALAADGLVAREDDRLRATARGRLVLNAVLAELLAD
jgi:oxygen-independent coproporphyrinogen-3 oxidase